MNDAVYLDQAAIWSKDLTRMKARGPGDTENAMRQIEREYGVDYGFLWSLRYRRDRLRTISISVYESIRAAYRAECAAQMRKLENEIKRTEEIAGSDVNSVRSAKALLQQSVGKD
ncbi:hypothetical protein [Bradyrhizobium icense]|uniref:Uncharacterized protein n=1 Tax=Bradyrhizobium icense TaxID=1274631 RepID=A0A1B1UD25_9BRAD|nr:hypothetical protein [Bradyrhizobium icense]ANW00669.1 hypothetical protein LMTR13_11320 [Bradyrhizobium icense]